MNRAKPTGDGDDALFARIAHGGEGGAKSRRTGRRSITLYIKKEIIEACGSQPGKKLRLWIEANFPRE